MKTKFLALGLCAMMISFAPVRQAQATTIEDFINILYSLQTQTQSQAYDRGHIYSQNQQTRYDIYSNNRYDRYDGYNGYDNTYGRGRFNTPIKKDLANAREVEVWAKTAVTDILSLRHNKYQRQIKDSRAYFTQAGWTDFSRGFKKSSIHNALKKHDRNITAYINGDYRTHVTQKKGYWDVSVPLVITQKDQSGLRTRFYRAKMRISETGAERYGEYLGIKDWKLEEIKNYR